ncbi:hypothetical protein CVT25_013806 [Psilocybe cyanescens]|uniref:Uncharacterized protein n=1 Tax=Psilocybe cyanescens TaxID=93625 RepID=A0A409XUY4_PSICY|nr:hypothetical protein CVT25_013806 [Psilocybe cyanescens]
MKYEFVEKFQCPSIQSGYDLTTVRCDYSIARGSVHLVPTAAAEWLRLAAMATHKWTSALDSFILVTYFATMSLIMEIIILGWLVNIWSPFGRGRLWSPKTYDTKEVV